MRHEYEAAMDVVIGAAKRLLFALRWEDLEQKYRPDQPRVPAGSSGGGRWTGVTGEMAATPDAGPEVADGLFQEIADRQAPPRAPVSLVREEAEGGHAISTHVAKSNSELVRTLEAEMMGDPWLSGRVYGVREGSFNDLATADRYVNDVLGSNPAVIEAVASGRSSDAFVEKRYTSPTGREAFRHRGDPKGVVRLRPTFSVGVHIVHVGHGKGFNVRTAYPKNRESDY